jgi:hypothetical protein
MRGRWLTDDFTADARGREESTDCVDDAMRHFHFSYTYTSLFYRLDQTRPDCTGLHRAGLDRLHHISTSPHLTPTSDEQSDRHPHPHPHHRSRRRGRRVYCTAVLVCYVCMYVYHTPHGRPGARVSEPGRGITLFYLTMTTLLPL